MVGLGSNINLKVAACSHLCAPPALPRHATPPPCSFHCPCREIIKDEETTFSRTLVKGLEQFHKFAEGAKGGKLAPGQHPRCCMHACRFITPAPALLWPGSWPCTDSQCYHHNSQQNKLRREVEKKCDNQSACKKTAAY